MRIADSLSNAYCLLRDVITQHHPFMIVWLLLGACKNGPINPDIGGPFVAVANIINCYFLSCLNGHLTCRRPYLCSYCGIGSQNLTLADSHQILSITAASSSLYVAACLLQRFGVETYLFRKISSSEAKVIILWLGLALPPLWLALSCISLCHQPLGTAIFVKGQSSQATCLF